MAPNTDRAHGGGGGPPRDRIPVFEDRISLRLLSLRQTDRDGHTDGLKSDLAAIKEGKPKPPPQSEGADALKSNVQPLEAWSRNNNCPLNERERSHFKGVHLF